MSHVIGEDSRARTTWDLVILALIVVSCILVPYQLAFAHRVTVVGSLLVYVIDLFFLFDIYLNFRMSTIVERSLGAICAASSLSICWRRSRWTRCFSSQTPRSAEYPPCFSCGSYVYCVCCGYS
jgi:hypothetical protein